MISGIGRQCTKSGSSTRPPVPETGLAILIGYYRGYGAIYVGLLYDESLCPDIRTGRSVIGMDAGQAFISVRNMDWIYPDLLSITYRIKYE